MRFTQRVFLPMVCALLCGSAGFAEDREDGQTYRLYDGITAYVNNPGGKSFSVHLELRDINVMARGPSYPPDRACRL